MSGYVEVTKTFLSHRIVEVSFHMSGYVEVTKMSHLFPHVSTLISFMSGYVEVTKMSHLLVSTCQDMWK